MEPSFLESKGTNNLAKAIASLNGENSYSVPNRFEVLILPPGKGKRWNAQEVSLRCESILLPGRNLNTLTDGMPYGPTREIVDGVTYAEDISMVFHASSGLDERVFFDEWQTLAFDERSWNVGYYNDYAGTAAVEIYLLDRQDQRRYGIKLIEAFPKTIGPTELSHASNNEIIKIAVSFSFRYWETLDINRQPSSLTDRIYDTVVNTVQRNIDRNIPRVLTRLF